ncbi:MAG: class I SAM-dependent methyltransferase [Candidatus Omnitrophica bacterium]|nr:class I SAM-dependent methyltransferase [Candidatus Omnitrophota bacterium]MCB9747512.1 class I SAM-dependent methyltransferase [Candidatus Omnitrophota bacterium]
MIVLLPNHLHHQQITAIAQEWGFEIRPACGTDQFVLEFFKDRLQLRRYENGKTDILYVDFCSPQIKYRLKFGGGRRQAIAKAVGLKKKSYLNIVDATAGLGRDAFILAGLGCRVHMLERSPVMAALLEDGLRRARLDSDVGFWVEQRLTFSYQNSCQDLSNLPFVPDVIYLDPMYPQKKKKALVKKEMQVLQALIGEDHDANVLLRNALAVVKERVVVKRPSLAGWLNDKKTTTFLKTKNHRFDIYLKNQ